MKTWKQNACIGMVAIIVFIFGIVACDDKPDDDNGKNDPETVEPPTANPPQGNYNEPQNVELSTSTTGASIYYTIDGNTPTVNSTLFSSPIPINATTTIKAFAVKSGMNDSGVFSTTYTIISTLKKSITVPAITDIANPMDFGAVSALSGWDTDFPSSDVTYTLILSQSGVTKVTGTTSISAAGQVDGFYTITQTFSYKGSPIPNGSRSSGMSIDSNEFYVFVVSEDVLELGTGFEELTLSLSKAGD
jgi:hypothetical protein